METKKRKKKAWPWIFLLLLLLAGGAYYYYGDMIFPEETPEQKYDRYTVSRGDISTTITGSGRLEMADSLQLELPGSVEVSEIFVKVGDSVEEGTALCSLDPESLHLRMLELSSQLEALDARLALRSTVNSILAPVKGRVKYLPAKEGDSVLSLMQQQGALAILSTDGLMQIDLESDAELSLHSKVKVEWEEGSAEGKVAERIEGGYRITLSDKNAPYLSAARVYDGINLLGEGILQIHAPIAVHGIGGSIDEVRCELNDNVKVREELFRLKDAPLSVSYQQSLSQREDCAESLAAVLSYLEDPFLYAPKAGLISQILVQEGEKTPAVSVNADAFTLMTGGASRMYISVDELDIPMVASEQPVSITLDAYSGESFPAVVSHVSRLGKAANSITTYEVELRLEADERLLPGMNGSAVITADTRKDVLLIPVAAIHEDAEGVYVNLENPDGSSSRTQIRTGLSNGTYAEVTEGLMESDVILYIDPARSNYYFNAMMGADPSVYMGGA